jgi:pyrroloquinoline quinone (PQQ) biosynthesis protein C
MEQHIFAVWDFMSLLKQLQNLLSCNQVPWRPSGHPAASRLINEIVWGEESDINRKGEPMSHFEMYLEAMESLGANPKEMYRIIEQLRSGKNIEFILENNSIPQHIKEFMSFTFEVVKTDQPHIIAAVFTFGREDLIPDMFIEIIKNLKKSNKENLEDLIYYFERHIEVDADEHGPLALEMIQQLCGNDTSKWDEALDYSKKALELRIGLWGGILNEIQKQNKLNFVA